MAIPPPRWVNTAWTLPMTPARRTGSAKLRLTLRDPVTERPVPSFVSDSRAPRCIVHHWPRTSSTSSHVHPQPVADGMFELRRRCAAGRGRHHRGLPAERRAGADGSARDRHARVPRQGVDDAAELIADDSTVKTIDGVRVQLAASRLRAGKEALLRFSLTDVATGKEPGRPSSHFSARPGTC